jgi:hypothetical protein
MHLKDSHFHPYISPAMITISPSTKVVRRREPHTGEVQLGRPRKTTSTLRLMSLPQQPRSDVHGHSRPHPISPSRHSWTWQGSGWAEDAEHGADGDDGSNNSVLESAADRENYATTGLGCGPGAYGGGNSAPSGGTTTKQVSFTPGITTMQHTSPTSQPWMIDAGFLHSRLIRYLLLKMA